MDGRLDDRHAACGDGIAQHQLERDERGLALGDAAEVVLFEVEIEPETFRGVLDVNRVER